MQTIVAISKQRGEIEGGGGVVENRGDVVTAAEVEGQLDAGVDLGIVPNFAES